MAVGVEIIRNAQAIVFMNIFVSLIFVVIIHKSIFDNQNNMYIKFDYIWLNKFFEIHF